MASTVDAAITGLYALLSAAPALAGVTVHDGPPVVSETAEWIAVGYSPGESTSADINYEDRDVGGRSQREQYDLLCSLVTNSGDEGMQARRARAVVLRDAVAAVLLTDATLGGAVDVARMTSAQLVQEQTSQGASAGYVFRVTCKAVISS
jgi:hypothetical protein